MALPSCLFNNATQSKRPQPPFSNKPDAHRSDFRERSFQPQTLRSLAPTDSSNRDDWLNNQDTELLSLSMLEDSMQSMQRSVFERLKPLESQPGVKSMDLSGACSPGLTDELQELSFTSKNSDGHADAVVTKPSISFACLIAMAILDSEHKRLTVSEVYEWMKKTYPYFNSSAAGTGWKNSVRHNLSLNKHFVKQMRDDGEPGGKGSYWRIRPESMSTMEITIRKQGGGHLSRRLDDLLAQGQTQNATKPLPENFTQKVSLPRRNNVSRPKAQPSRRLKSLNNTESPSTMDDEEAAAMLCSFSEARESATNTDDGSQKGAGKRPLKGTFPSLWKPSVDSLRASVSTSSSASNTMSNNGLLLDTLSSNSTRSNKRRNPSFKASYAPNAHKSKSPNAWGDTSASDVKTFTYIPSSIKRPRRGLTSSTSKAHAAAQEVLFTPKSVPTSDTSKMSIDADVTMEEIPRSPSVSNVSPPQPSTSSSSTSTDRPLFTFSGSMSTSRYTPEGQTTRGDDKNLGFSPPKTRRKLGLHGSEIGAKMQDTTDAVAAALLNLSGAAYTLHT